jgi:hypothetical protein
MSSKITQEKYDLVKIERLKHYLESSHEKGKPKFYEIFVDNLKAVDKTSDPDQFDEYLVYMSEDTRMVKVLIYTSTESCPRNDKFLFTVTSPEKEREEKRKQELSGIEIEEKIHSVVQQERDKMNMELLKKEVERLEQELEESEEYAEELQNKLEELKASKATSKEGLGEAISIAFESLVRRNAHLLGGIPLVGQGLAGVIEQDNKRLEQKAQNSLTTATEGKVTVQKEEEAPTASFKPSSFSDEDRQTLNYFNSLREAFTETELAQVFQIIGALSYDKESIPSVLELLKEESDDESSEEQDDTDKSKVNSEALREKANQF